MFDEQPPSRLKVQVMEKEYQPINAPQGRGGRGHGVQILVAARYSVRDGKGRGQRSGSPSLLKVLVKTYFLQFLESVFYKVPNDLLDFANPLILK